MFFSRTWFCSLRPQVLTEIGSVLFDRRSQRNSVPFLSSARSKQNSVLSRAAGSQRNSLLFPDGRVPTEPGSVHPGQLLHNGTRFCSPGRLLLNGTQFRSRAADSQRNSVPLTSGCIPTEPGSVHPGQLHHNGTRFCSPGRPVLNGTQFRFRTAASQRNSVLFSPDGCIPTETGSVHPGG